MSDKRKANEQRIHDAEKMHAGEEESKQLTVPNAPVLRPPPFQLTANPLEPSNSSPIQREGDGPESETGEGEQYTFQIIFAGSGARQWDPGDEDRDPGDRMIGGMEAEDQIVFKEEDETRMELEYAGPLGGLAWVFPEGTTDRGGNSTENNADHARLILAAYIEGLEDSISAENPLQVPILSHSRGAATASQMAAEITRRYGDRVKVSIVMFDPVPGHGGNPGIFGSRDNEVDLSEVDNSSWVLPVDAGKSLSNFSPQELSGVSRLIVSIDNNFHSAGMTEEAPFMLDGEPVEGMALSELPEGVYVTDAGGNLSPISSHAKWVQWWNETGYLLSNFAEGRNRIVPDAVDAMFGLEAGSTPTPQMPLFIRP